MAQIRLHNTSEQFYVFNYITNLRRLLKTVFNSKLTVQKYYYFFFFTDQFPPFCRLGVVRPGQQLLFYFILCANFRVHDPVRAAVRVQDYNQVRQKIYISHHTVEALRSYIEEKAMVVAAAWGTI